MNAIKKNLWFILIFIFAAFFYLFNINFSDIWIDEAFTKALVKHSFRDITGLIRNDFHPPLYFYALKIFVSIFGISVFTIRLFSVLGALATIFFLYAVLSITTSRRSNLLFLMLFSLIAAYTHYYALLAAFWANVFVFFFLLINKNKNLKVHLIYSLAALLLYLPWLLVMLSQMKEVSESFWVPALDWQIIASCLLSPFAPKIYLPPFLPLAIIIYGLVLWVIY